MSKLEKAIVGAIDEVEIIFKSEGKTINKTVKKFGRFKKLKPNDQITVVVPNIDIEVK